MHIALISDIHGNLPAFEAIADDLSSRQYDILVFLGDLVINGLYPGECVQLLDELKPAISIQGNTDGFFTEIDAPWRSGNEQEQYLYGVMDFARQRLTSVQINAITSRPIYHQSPDGSIGFCHGSPFSYDEKLQESQVGNELALRIGNLGLSRLFFGHTHMRQAYTLGHTTCTNVGAVGYRFDGDTSAAYGIFDTDSHRLQLFDIPYDRDAYLRALSRSDAPFKDNISGLIKHARIISS